MEEMRVQVKTDADIVTARQKGRILATQLGFSSTDLTLITTAISELARNIVSYAEAGEIVLRPLEGGNKRGLAVIAHDDGPGIPNVEQALHRGYSTSGSLGLGLPGVRLLMDEFTIVSQVGQGTTITAKKWKR